MQHIVASLKEHFKFDSNHAFNKNKNMLFLFALDKIGYLTTFII